MTNQFRKNERSGRLLVTVQLSVDPVVALLLSPPTVDRELRLVSPHDVPWQSCMQHILNSKRQYLLLLS